MDLVPLQDLGELGPDNWTRISKHNYRLFLGPLSKIVLVSSQYFSNRKPGQY
jgi:hypothetical protein